MGGSEKEVEAISGKKRNRKELVIVHCLWERVGMSEGEWVINSRSKCVRLVHDTHKKKLERRIGRYSVRDS